MIPALFSVSYAGLWGQHRLDLEAFLLKAAALGYPAVEIMGKRPHLSILDADDARLGHLRETAERHHVTIATVAGYTDFTAGRHAAEVPFLEMQLAYVKALARAASRLGARIVRVFTGYATARESGLADWDNCVQAIRACADVTAEYGVQLGVQNHHDTGIGCAAYLEFLGEVDHPNCRALFDPWAPAVNGEDYIRYAGILAPRMAQTTLADYVRLPRYQYLPGLINYQPLPDMIRAVPLGEGFVDYKAFLAALKKGGFEGYVAYEMCSPLRGGGGEANLDRTARISLEKIKSAL